MKFQFSFSGAKVDAVQAVDVQVTDPAGAPILKAIIAAQLGDQISMSASCNDSSISVSGSFWSTPK